MTFGTTLVVDVHFALAVINRTLLLLGPRHVIPILIDLLILRHSIFSGREIASCSHLRAPRHLLYDCQLEGA